MEIAWDVISSSVFSDVSAYIVSILRVVHARKLSVLNYRVLLDAEAVPKKILELMNVEKLTRENVASHLQVNFLTYIPLTVSNWPFYVTA